MYREKVSSMRQERMVYALGLSLILLLVWRGESFGQEREVTITSREIVERLARLEQGQKALEQRIGEVKSGLEQQIKDTNRRIDELKQDIGQRIDELRQFLFWGFGMTFAGMFALVGFVIWDRRSALAPAVRRIEDLKEREERLEAAIREYAAKVPELAESLKKMGLL